MIDTGKTLALGMLTLCVNIVLMAVKISVGIIGNSYAMIADGIESAGDILSSIITWAGFQLSLRPADEDHPYGHGKIESLAGLFSGAALLIAAVVIGWHSVLEILTPHHAPAWFTLPVLFGVVVAKWTLAKVIEKVNKQVDSRALEGDAWHHLSDAITSGAAAIGIAVALIGGPGWESADDYAALLACVIIVVNGLIISKNALHDVLDGNVSEDLINEMRAIAAQVEGVRKIEKCRIRKSGIGMFIELHVWIDGDLTVREGHHIGHLVKSRVQNEVQRVIDTVVHIEPAASDAGEKDRSSPGL
ncbi:cation-efflux pump [Spartobacteria bacterium LR76]|nr:cation-efflux pump [Spartobacteria bacterium LR76]